MNVHPTLQDLYNECRQTDSIVLDVETTGFDWNRDELLGVGLCTKPLSAYWLRPEEPGVHDFMTDLFKLDKSFVFHNGKFDLHFLKKYGVPQDITDTMIVSQLINEVPRHDLTSLTVQYLTSAHNFYVDQVSEYKKKNKIKSFSEFPPELLGMYCMEQCSNTYELHDLLYPRIDSLHLSDVYLVEKELLTILFEMEEAGVLLDFDYLEQLREKLSRILRELEKGFPVGFDPNSPKQVRNYLTEQGIAPVLFTTKGNPSWSEEALRMIDHPQAQNIVAWRTHSHTINTFIDPYLIDSYNHRIHCKFKQIGAGTGRMACVEPNLQQVPAGPSVRRAFIGGITMYDYDQQEARLLGHLSNDPSFIAACSNSSDVYSDFAKMIFSVKNPSEIFGSTGKSYRDVTKGIMLGIMYGMGDKKLRAITGLEDSSTKDIEIFFSNLRQYRAQREAEVRLSGYTRTMIGRRRPLRQEFIYKTINSMVQGSAADIMKIAMVGMPPHLRNKMRIAIHDALLFEGLEPSEKEEARDVMCNFNFKIPLTVSYGAGDNWAEAEEQAKASKMDVDEFEIEDGG